MTLQFYNISDDPRVVKKTLGTVTQTLNNVYMKDDTDLITPTFILTGNINAATFGNYLYVTEFSRYYYIRNQVTLFGGKTGIQCEIDPLMTWADQILNTDVVVFNQSNTDLADSLIADGRIPMQVNAESRTFQFQPGELTANLSTSSKIIVFSCFAGGTTPIS